MLKIKHWEKYYHIVGEIYKNKDYKKKLQGQCRTRRCRQGARPTVQEGHILNIPTRHRVYMTGMTGRLLGT